MSYIPKSILNKYDGVIVTYKRKDGSHYTEVKLISNNWWVLSKKFTFLNTSRIVDGACHWFMDDYTEELVIYLNVFYKRKEEYGENK